jgi:hypothetical protein
MHLPAATLSSVACVGLSRVRSCLRFGGKSDFAEPHREQGPGSGVESLIPCTLHLCGMRVLTCVAYVASVLRSELFSGKPY